MRKRLVGGAFCCAMLALLVAAFATAGPDKDIVNGTIGVAGQTVTMDSQTLSDSTTSARGSWSFSGPGFSYSGTVDTLIVKGDIATACGTITASSNPAAIGDVFQQYVNDTGNGSPQGSGDTSESFIDSPGTACIDPTFYNSHGFGILNTSGNWHVFDADATA